MEEDCQPGVSRSSNTLEANIKPGRLSESMLVALEVSGTLLPPSTLAQKISSELKSIRSAFPVVSDIFHLSSFTPGSLISDKITDEQIEQVESSEFGPLKHVDKMTFGEKFRVVAMQFKEPYHPKRLSEKLKDQFGIETSIDSAIGDGNNVKYNPQKSVYTFKRGWGDCPSGCIYNHFWEFSVAHTGDVNLQKEYGSPLSKYRPGMF